jgi:hypothetical protein
MLLFKPYTYNYKALNIMLVLVLIFLLRDATPFPFVQTVANYASVFILLIGLSVLFSWWKSGQQKTLNRDINSIFRFWLLMLVWFFSVPIIFFNLNFGTEFFYEGMYHDYRYLLFATLPFVFISDYAKKYYDKIFKNVGYVAVIAGLLAILIADKSFTSISNRNETFSLPYYLWWIVLMAYPYLFLNYYFTRKSKIGLYLIIIHFILSFIFLKRAGLVNGILVILFAFIFSENNNKRIISTLALLLVVIFSSFFFSEYIDLLMARFEADSQNLDEWDRKTEVDELFSSASELELFTGFGANNYLKMYYVGVYDKGLNSMHIGAYNILYKGGLLYVGFILFLVYQIISLYRYLNFNNEIKIAFILGLTFIISFTYEQGWSYVPIIFFTLLPIYRGIYLKDKIKSQIANKI